jgi:hypothetical protein
MHEECENCEAGVLLEHFWYGAIFRTQFALLLFPRDLMSSILSFVTGLSFVVKRPLVKKQVEVIYSNCSRAFLKRIFYCEGTLLKKHRVGIYCALQTFLWKNPLGIRRS